MKNRIFKYIIGAFVISTSLVSCSLDTSPTDAVEESKVFTTTADNEKVLIGAWGQLMESFYSFANPGYGAFLRAGDAMGSDVVLNGRYGFRDHYAFKALYGRGGTNTHSWELTYNTINNVNHVITKVDASEGSVSDKKRIKGQALALRGFMYLHLASNYSFAIDVNPNALTAPIYLEPTTINSSPKALASVRELYNQAVQDLEEALSLIPDTQTYRRGNAKGKIDQEVVLGLLSRATLYARDWEKAKKYSDALLAINDYLMTEEEYKGGFNDASNKEWIWGHQQTPNQSDASYQFNFLDVTSKESFYFSFNADPYFREMFDEGDYRKKMIYWAPDPANDKPKEGDEAYMRYAKFKFKAGQIADIVLMRTSEIYLINAEAKAQLGDGDALNKLNALKVARGGSQMNGLQGKALLEAIWVERRKELFGEGFSLVDIIRNQQSVVRKSYPQTKLVPFSYEVLDSNGKVNVVTVNLLPLGHRILNFPDQSDFAPNSKYYLFRVPLVEERENGNI